MLWCRAALSLLLFFKGIKKPANIGIQKRGSSAFRIKLQKKMYFSLKNWLYSSWKVTVSKIDWPPYGCHSEASFLTIIVFEKLALKLES